MTKTLAAMRYGTIDLTAKRTWTARHYLVPLIGSVAAVVYAAGLRVACMATGLPDPPIWVVALSGMTALWLGIFFSVLLLFDRRRK